MPRSLYVAAAEAESGKSAIALGVLDLLARNVERVGIFRPVVRATVRADPVIELLRARIACEIPYEASAGVTYDHVHDDPDGAIAEIVARFRALERDCDAVLIVGTDYTDVGAATELWFNAQVAVNLGAPVICVVAGRGRSIDDLLSATDLAVTALHGSRCEVAGVIVNRVDPVQVDGLIDRLAERGKASVSVVPDEPLLSAPTVKALADACEARVLGGDPSLWQHEALGFVVAAMTLPNLLDRLVEGAVVVTPGDRADVLLGVLSAQASGSFPPVSALFMTGGLEVPPPIARLLDGLNTRLPLALAESDTYETVTRLAAVRGRLDPKSPRKVETALALFEEHVDAAALLERTAVRRSGVVTPLMFEYDLLDRARSDRRRVVLPEGDDERVLRAADTLLRRGVAELILLGDETQVRAKATRLGVDVDEAQVFDPHDPALRGRAALKYAQLRAHKGVTPEMARDVVLDVSYFGAMMMVLDLADGMVSGAAHTTADTIRPAFEVVKAQEGVSVVSSVFFMALADRVLVYGDCAVNPDPTAEQLADIAISSAGTAAHFGIEPRIAMLSYSTGESGAGADVHKVRMATALVRERRPDLSVEGPIQYDAAVDGSVARTKLPASDVAGRATVFIFPDLNTGNTTYKAVQRSAGALAVGPVLQGLRRPVNDLSRGATVRDIVNTVAITAIQAQA